MAKLSPVFNDQTFDANGDPAVGYRLWTFVADSSTPQITYSDEAGTIANSNPIILDSLGYATQGPIWLQDGTKTKFVLTIPSDLASPPSSSIKTIDDVTGVGDNTVSTDQWQASGVTPTYISESSFSLVGDQTSDFHVGRRLQFTVSAGTVYGNITASAYTTLTTVTVQVDAGTVLDSGLSAVNLSILRADHLAVPSVFNQSISWVGTSVITAKGASVAGGSTTAVFGNTDGNVVDISGTGWTCSSFGTASQAGQVVEGQFAGSGTLTQGTNLNLNAGGESVDVVAGDRYRAVANTTSQIDVTIIRKSGQQVGIRPSIRQTVLMGSVDSNGFAAFGGSTGTTTVTASTTLRVTAASGYFDRVGTTTNPSWTGLSTNGTMYLYLDVAADGSCTTGSTTLQPTYRWGGADVTTNGQFTFNISTMSGKVGDGTNANAVYRVFVGEVSVSGAVVSAITWYALQGRYYFRDAAGLTLATSISRNHLIGCDPRNVTVNAYCYTANLGYFPGDRIPSTGIITNTGGQFVCNTVFSNRLVIGIASNTTGVATFNKSTGAYLTLTNGNFGWEYIADRGW